MAVYRWLRPLLFRLQPEQAHDLAMGGLSALGHVPGALRAMHALFPPPAKPVHAMGLRFDNPIGLAAGLDKDARVFEVLGALGFGFVEVGTVTPEPQPGNERPRLFRLADDRALINRMGFNNRGCDAMRRRLERPRRTLVGVNIGKNKATPESRANEDFARCARELGPLADYVVVNVSSPNTPGLRDLQNVERLGPLLSSVQAELETSSRRIPLCLKLAPDLAEPDLDAIADLCVERKIDGIVATNTTISRDGLATPGEIVASLGAGGLSGAPLRARSLHVLEHLRNRVGDQLCLIGVGGIASPQDVRDRLAAGASLVQLYTSFIYEGPALPRTLASAV